MPYINKQISILLFFCTIFSAIAQKEKIYYGSPSTRGAEFHFKEDNTYNIILKQGKHDKIITRRGNIAIYIEDIGFDVEGFNVTEDYSEVIKDSITVNFYRRGIDSNYDKYYLGYKTKGDKKFTYLNLSYETLLFNTDSVKPYNFTGFLSVRIPRTREIQFVVLEDEAETNSKEKKEKYLMNQFSLSKNTANVYVDYRKIRDKKNIYNSKFVVADIYGSSERILDIDKKAFSAIFTPSTYVKRTKIGSFIDWKIPQLVKKEIYKKFDNPKYVYKPVITITPAHRDEKYKKHDFEQLKDAVAAVKSDESKVLLVFNSLLKHNDVAYFYDIFDGIYSGAEKSYLSDYNYDKFLAYYIKPEDLPELKKYKPESSDEVFCLNSDLDILYTENITTEDFYYKYDGVNAELSGNLLAINELNKLNRRLKTKNTTAKTFLDFGKHRSHEIINSAMNIEPNAQIQEIGGEKRKRYSRFKTKVQYFYPKINHQEIKQEFNRLVEKHKKDTVIDLDYAKLALDFISVDPFFENISGINAYSPTKMHYEFCLYLSRFPVDTSKIYKDFAKMNGGNHYAAIRKILENEHGEKEKYPNLITTIYKNLDRIESEKYYSIFEYYVYLYNHEKLDYKRFDALVNEITPLNENYNQQVESFYTTCNCLYVDDVKYYLSVLGNAMAWDAVTKSNTDKNLLKKALKWSKLSNEFSPNNHNYLDTLANLEYFLGNKKRAISLESKAIQLASDTKHKNLKEYTETLAKMKLNTLKH